MDSEENLELNANFDLTSRKTRIFHVGNTDCQLVYKLQIFSYMLENFSIFKLLIKEKYVLRFNCK